MAKLGKDHKVLIVQRLATFVTPTEIQTELRETYKLEVSLRQIVYYDPAAKNSEIAPGWRTLFEETRALFTKDTSDIAISHRSFRLRELDRMFRKVATAPKENIPLGKELLIEAERFTGDAYTNRRQLTGADGAPLIPAGPRQNLANLTTEQLLEFERLTALATVVETTSVSDTKEP